MWVRWVAAGVLLSSTPSTCGCTSRDEPEETEPDALNQLHVTRLPGMAGPHTLDIDILPGEKDSWEIDGAVPRMRIIVSQVVLALALIIIGAQVFVGAVEHLSTVIGLDPTILALIIAPIATELPEKFNSVLWVRTGKDTLAMGNITGAMVFQSCLPTVLGLLFTDVDVHAGDGHPFAVGRCRLRLHRPDLRDDAAARAPVGMDIADRWSAVPDLRLPGPLHAPRAWLAMGTRPRIPQPSRRAGRHGKGRAYTCPRRLCRQRHAVRAL